MIELDLAVGAGAIAEAWLVALVVLRGRRPWLQSTFAAFGLTLIVNAAASVGTDVGALPSSWELAVLSTMVLGYPLAAILVLGLLHGESLPRRRPVVFLLLAAVPLLILATPPAQWTTSYAYDLTPLGGFLGICLAIALGEAAYQQMTGRLYAGDASWLVLAIVLLIVGGPVYTIEFAALNLPVAAGSNPVAVLALAVFALVMLRTAPYPTAARPKPGRWSGEATLTRRGVFVFDERRPVYAFAELRQEASTGRPTLLIARSSAPEVSGPLAVARIGAGRHAASRVLTTAAEFLALSPGGLVGLADLGDVSLASGWESTREMLSRLGTVAADTDGTVLVATACLTRPEREDLKAMQPSWWTLPDPATEIEAVLDRSFGSGAKSLLSTFSREESLRPTDLAPDRIPDLTAFLQRTVLEPGAAVADPAALGALRKETAAAVDELERFASRSAADLAQGDWPSKAAVAAERDLVVTADAYWKGRPPEAPLAPPRASPLPFFERAQAVFVECLGPAGEGIFRSEVAKLGRRPQEFRAQDVARLADRAAVDLGAMVDVVDVPQEKLRIRSQIESIRRRLEAIAEVEG